MDQGLIDRIRGAADRTKKCEFVVFFDEDVHGYSVTVPSGVAENFGVSSNNQRKYVWVVDGWVWACKCQVNMEAGRVVIGREWRSFVEYKNLNKGDPILFKFDGGEGLKVTVFDAATEVRFGSWFLMAKARAHLPWLPLIIICFALFINHTASQENRQAYIVYMGNQPQGSQVSTSALHNNMIREVAGSNDRPETVICDYKRSFHGFTAMLTPEEARKMAGMTGVVSVFPDTKLELLTTRSWDFLGFTQQVGRRNLESDIIIGVIDSGIWPESDSFSDLGFGPPPSKWRGSCQESTNFACNNKIIGARYYRSNTTVTPNDILSPIDTNGHGTHTASTVAGNPVANVSLDGFASGTARGGVPSARIAVYKACWSDGCSTSDILAAFDDAIADGVDIISVSLGSRSAPDHYFRDVIAIGSFSAMRNGILTSCSAGNNGPSPSTISNYAPWIFTVAANTIDRKFSTDVQLGNNITYEGVSVNTFDLNNTMYTLIYGRDAPNTVANFTNSSSRICSRDSLDRSLGKGKIVICDGIGIDKEGPFLAGAAGALMQSGELAKDFALPFPLPAAQFSDAEGIDILRYTRSVSNATATIFRSREVNETLAPFVVSFSSRGPNPITPDILKPDISAPGVDILAAWSPLNPVSEVEGDNRFVTYNIVSGTSMACPHVSAAAAYVKSFHPTWSPAAIKSALMTTATSMNLINNTEAEFAHGAGHVNPIRALNPGLVYDLDPIDYVTFLCRQGYNTTMLRLVTGDNSVCSRALNSTVSDLNYPSFVLSTTRSMSSVSRVFNRVVTNVGSPSSTYRAIITPPNGFKIQANPNVLSFTSLGQRLSFTLTVVGTIPNNETVVSASLVWDDGVRQVRSPIVVYAVGRN